MSERQGATIKGLATVLCWNCKTETENVAGQMGVENEETLFLAYETFTCPHCEAEGDYAWSDFQESA